MIHSTTDATTRSLFSYRSEACAGMCTRRLGRPVRSWPRIAPSRWCSFPSSLARFARILTGLPATRSNCCYTKATAKSKTARFYRPPLRNCVGRADRRRLGIFARPATRLDDLEDARLEHRRQGRPCLHDSRQVVVDRRRVGGARNVPSTRYSPLASTNGLTNTTCLANCTGSG